MRRTYDVSRSAINRGRSRSYLQRQGLSLSQVWVQWSIRRTGAENNGIEMRPTAAHPLSVPIAAPFPCPAMAPSAAPPPTYSPVRLLAPTPALPSCRISVVLTTYCCYEGHDEPHGANCPNPKVVDQPLEFAIRFPSYPKEQRSR